MEKSYKCSQKTVESRKFLEKKRILQAKIVEYGEFPFKKKFGCRNILGKTVDDREFSEKNGYFSSKNN